MISEKDSRFLLYTSFDSAISQCRLRKWQWKCMDLEGVLRSRPVYADPNDPGDLIGLYVKGGFVYRVELPDSGWLGDCELVNYGAER